MKPQKPATKPRRSGRKRVMPSSGKAGGYLPILLGAILAVAIGIFLAAFYGDRMLTIIGRPPERKKIELSATEKEVGIYFSSVDGLGLHAEKTRIKKGTVEEELNAALALLVKGPDDKDLGPTIPEGASVRGVRIKGQTVVVDFSPEISSNHPGGSSGELQTVYSVVNTVALNFPQFKSVQILVDGKKAETIAGHIDITAPLGPDPKMVKE